MFLQTCPEDGASMTFDRVMRRFTCPRCGLNVTGDELRAMHKRKTPELQTPEEKRSREREDVLSWWPAPK